jgi:hypothetical protein
VAWREDRVRFWAAIGRGLKSDEAGVEAGVSSPVAYRWFRHAGGVNPCLPPTVTGRYLSFSEREDIAIWHAQVLGVREIARRLNRSPSTISRELRRKHRRGPGVSTTRPRLRSGMPNVGPEGPRWPNWPPTSCCVSTFRSDCLASREHAMADSSAHLVQGGTGRASPTGRIVAG